MSDEKIFLNSHSLYFLGKQSASISLLQRYHQLVEKCSGEGEFLVYENRPEWLSCYERDAQFLHTKLPLLVFRPRTTANIAPFLQVCSQMAIAVTVRCGGTGLMGSSVPSTESVVLLTGHFKQIRHYDPEKGMLSIEPGVTARELNRHIAAEGWYFPLSLASEGVAGLAGCLSCHARGYHQQQQAIYDTIQQATLVDGQGQVLEVPAAWVCGAEGLWGVIIEIKVRLKKKPSQCREFRYAGSWQELLTRLPFLRLLHSLVFVTWFQNQFYLGIEGELWRMPSATAYLVECLPEIQPMKRGEPSRAFIPSCPTFIVVSTVFNPDQLPEACQWSMEQAQQLQLECFQQADVLAGSLHLILQMKGDPYPFARKVEQFLVLWTDFVERRQGVLAGCHGVGMQMRPYMPPFWTEESQGAWRNLQATFDPRGLFAKERFFPVVGKSLEKRGIK